MTELYFLISSLPTLRQGAPPPLSQEHFLSLCSSWLTESQLGRLRAVKLLPGDDMDFPPSSIVKQWKNWETCLRNMIASTRRPPFHADPSAYIKNEEDYFSEIERGVQEAFSSPDPLSKEKHIDGMRWKKLDDLESGHLFDVEKLSIYFLKLQILEKWTSRTAETGTANFDALIGKISMTVL